MIVTVFCDASFCSETRAAGWAVWLKFGTDRDQTKRFCGQILHDCGNSMHAEMAAAANALFVTTRALTLTSEDRIILQTDCMAVVQILKGQPNRALRKKYVRDCKAVVDSALSCGVRLEPRHVKAHTRMDDPRSWVNRWCDQTAFQQMKLARAVRRQFVKPVPVAHSLFSLQADGHSSPSTL